jgi:hypothetical protein
MQIILGSWSIFVSLRYSDRRRHSAQTHENAAFCYSDTRHTNFQYIALAVLSDIHCYYMRLAIRAASLEIFGLRLVCSVGKIQHF